MRNKSLDIARGALILYIITIIHGAFWLDIIPRPYSSLLLFEMPLIFTVSGYSYAIFEKSKQFKLNLQNYVSYVISRSSRILVPYFVYALFCAAIPILIDFKDARSNILEPVLAWLNPFVYGKGYSIAMLNAHLWFIVPFLLVTLLLPFVTKYCSSKLPLWLIGIAAFSVIAIFEGTSFAQFTKPIFYLFWAYLGYVLAGGVKITRIRCFLFGASGIAILLLSKLFFTITLDMQANKFPPNSLFFVFSIVWLSFFLLVITHLNARHVEFLAESIWFKPFIASGYSIYLWQGMGYTLMNALGSRMDLPIYLTWLLAILLTVALGIIFGPIERVRFRVKKGSSAQSLKPAKSLVTTKRNP